MKRTVIYLTSRLFNNVFTTAHSLANNMLRFYFYDGLPQQYWSVIIMGWQVPFQQTLFDSH